MAWCLSSVQVKELECGLERERRRYRDIRAEYDHLKLAASVDPPSTSIFTAPSDSTALEKELRERNLALERRVAELQVRAEGEEREVQRLREEVRCYMCCICCGKLFKNIILLSHKIIHTKM